MKFSIKDFFSKYDQICSFMRIWSRLLKKSVMENFIFCAVTCPNMTQISYDFIRETSKVWNIWSLKLNR